MSASNTDKFKKLTNNFSTTLSSAIVGAGDSSMSLASTTNLPTGTGIVLVIDRVNSSGAATPSTREYVIGTVSGGNVTNLVRGQGNSTAQAHSTGAVVEQVVDQTTINDIIDGILKDHDQQGRHVQITDTNGNIIISLSPTGSAVNNVQAANAATGNAPGIGANGSDTNIDFEVYGKGTGSPRFRGYYDGWVKANETLTYSSWDSTYKTGIITVADGTGKYCAGNRIKITQATGGTKYFIITAVASTTITVYGGTDYTLTNETISSPYYSREKAPQGFPLDPAKWTVRVTSTTNSTSGSPTSGTYVNVAALDLAIPIGVWNVSFQVTMLISRTSGSGNASVSSCLSTTTNSASDTELRQYTQIVAATSGVQVANTIGQSRRKMLTLSSGTTYHFNWAAQDTGMATTGLYVGSSGDVAIVEAISAYL